MRRVTRWGSLTLAVCLVLWGAAGCDQIQAPTEPSATAANAAAPTAHTVNSVITAHAPDGFYEPPPDVPKKPGALLRSEPLRAVTLTTGLQGWRILYTTMINDTTPATAVATVFAPIDAPAGPRPVITWAHRTTGLVQKCMPSLASVPTRDIPALDQVVALGWVIVATDYSFAEKGGPHPYLIGEGEARATLDSVRAARQMPELQLDDRTIVWGHSQGGHSALWTGVVGPRYAPDIKILGVAAIAPAANISDIFERNEAADKRTGPYVALAYSRFYPDVTFEAALRPEARAAAREIVDLCGVAPAEDAKRIATLSRTFEGGALAMHQNHALALRLAQNVADQPIAAPVVIAQGLADEVVPPAATDAYVDRRCATGQQLEYWKFAGFDHGGIVRSGSPLEAPLVAWTSARFSNEPHDSGCARQSF
jgi:pimeloyl-ACP methyl ester carboxylesterase